MSFQNIASYSEASYFDGYAFHHIGVYEDHKRIERQRRSSLQLLERERRTGGRARR
jgi:hypothetical protein